MLLSLCSSCHISEWHSPQCWVPNSACLLQRPLPDLFPLSPCGLSLGLHALHLSKFLAQCPSSACFYVPSSIPLQLLAPEQLFGYSPINLSLKCCFPRPGSAYGLPCSGSLCPLPYSLSNLKWSPAFCVFHGLENFFGRSQAELYGNSVLCSLSLLFPILVTLIPLEEVFTMKVFYWILYEAW